MQIFAETDRLILREIVPSDEQGIFELDSDPEVQRFVGNKPITTRQQSREMIAYIREQYKTYGIGRWAVIRKDTGQFVGWAGLKFIRETINGHTHYYDLGYRLIKRYWGRGYASEAAIASLDYGFNQLQLKQIYGMADCRNTASRKVLQKAGLTYVQTFNYEGISTDWFTITRHPEI